MGEVGRTLYGGQREGGAFLDSPSSGQQEENLPFVLMSLAGETFAVEISRVREVIRVPKITWIPGVPAHIKGVFNLRGSVVPVIDLAVLISLPDSTPSQQSRIVIVDSSDELMGILVDSVSRVEEIAPSSLEPPMQTLDQKQRNFVMAQSSIDNVMVGMLDIDKVIKEARSARRAIK
ncbi:MAG: chemotaxis protein CheW [Thermoleophilia bacterium]